MEDAVAPVGLGFVGVAADYDLKAGRLRITVECVPIVQHIDTGSPKLDRCLLRKGLAPRLGVHIPSHGVNRRNVLELAKDSGIANVASMNDGVRSPKCRECFRTKQTVRVGDQAQDKGLHGYRLPEAKGRWVRRSRHRSGAF